MKRALTLLGLLALAVGLYLFAYPRLGGTGTETANAAISKGARLQPATAVTVALAQRQDVPITNSAVGLIEPINSVIVQPRVAGVVTAQDVTEGQLVKAGQVLFKLDDSAAQAVLGKDDATLAKDQATLQSANSELTRVQSLVKKQVDTQQQLDDAIAAQKVAAATIGIDQAQIKSDRLTLSYMTITAPVAGHVGAINTSVGNLVAAPAPSGLLTITQMAPVRVSFSVPESDLDGFRAALAHSVKVPVAIWGSGDSKPRATGTLDFIDSAVDTASGTVTVKAEIPNANESLWPGQYVTAVTELSTLKSATTIPLIAVQQDNAGPFVFLVGPDNKAKKVPIKLVTAVGNLAVVGPQIKVGDHVVIEGQLRLVNGSLVAQTVQPAKKLSDTDTAVAETVGTDATLTGATASVPVSTN